MEPQVNLDGTMDDLNDAWVVFTQMEATGWKFLPFSGGLMDQPEMLMSNVYRIANLVRRQQKDN